MTRNYRIGSQVISLLVVFAALYLTNLYSYLLFHSLAELFSIVIAFSFFIIVWHSKEFTKDHFDYLTFVGIAYMFVAVLDFLHLLSYKGMSIFKDYDYYANQLWIGARYLESLSLLAAFIFLYFKKRIKPYLTFVIYALITAAIIASIFYFKVFPICFVEGQGQTPFKIISEYIIILILIVDALLLVKNRLNFHRQVYQLMLVSIIFTILSEFGFTLYSSNYGFENLLGHYFKIVSFYLIYRAIIITCITEPNKIIFKNLTDKEEELMKNAMTDMLTGLYNRRAAIEFLGKLLNRASHNQEIVTICFIDVDNLKKTNDVYGHVEGDNLLLTVARQLVSHIREADYACRIGGDEFLLILPDTSTAGAQIIINRIKEDLAAYNASGTCPYPVDFSYGFSEYNDQNTVDIDALLEQADSKMYENKIQKRKATS